MDEPLRPPKARKLIRKILKEGIVHYSKPHAIQRLQERDISMVDCENVLLGGVVGEAELDKGSWRYPVRTARFEIIVQLLSENSLIIITAWRIQ